VVININSNAQSAQENTQVGSGHFNASNNFNVFKGGDEILVTLDDGFLARIIYYCN